MFSQIGIPGIILILVIILVAFGPKNLPSIGRSVGISLKEFKEGISGSVNNNKELESKNEVSSSIEEVSETVEKRDQHIKS